MTEPTAEPELSNPNEFTDFSAVPVDFIDHEETPPMSKEQIKDLTQRVLQISVEVKQIKAQITEPNNRLRELQKEKRQLTDLLRFEMSKNPLQGYTVRDDNSRVAGTAMVQRQVQNVNKMSLHLPEIEEWLYLFAEEHGQLTDSTIQALMAFLRERAQDRNKGKYNFSMKLSKLNQM